MTFHSELWHISSVSAVCDLVNWTFNCASSKCVILHRCNIDTKSEDGTTNHSSIMKHVLVTLEGLVTLILNLKWYSKLHLIASCICYEPPRVYIQDMNLLCHFNLELDTVCTYDWCRPTDVDEFLHAIWKAGLKHVWIDGNKALTLFKVQTRTVHEHCDIGV